MEGQEGALMRGLGLRGSEFPGVEAVGLNLMNGRHAFDSDHTLARRQGGGGREEQISHLESAGNFF